MAYKFGPDEPVRTAILRSAQEQLDTALSELTEHVADDPVEAVHGARKAIKKERSILRLARGAMPAKQRRQENIRLRDAARLLSDTRDSDVLVATLEDLAKRYEDQAPASTFAMIAEALKARSGEDPGGSTTSAVVAAAVQELHGVRLRSESWDINKGGWDAVESGLVRSYKRGRRAFATARATRSADDLHAWRKRAKDLWYHEQLLGDTCGPAVKGHAKDAHRLADLLGEDHDLALLRDELAREVLAVPVAVGDVVQLVDRRRDELQTEALHIGERVYAERAGSFKRRMRRSWKAGRAAVRPGNAITRFVAAVPGKT